MVAMSEQAVRDRGIDAAPMPFRVADPCAAHTWSSRVSQIRVNFDLSSYATDPSALPGQVLDGFAQIRESRALYEVIADFAVAGEPR